MEIIKKGKDLHPFVAEACSLHQAGRMSRREFLRIATLVGMSAAGASALAVGCTPAEPETEVPTEPTATEAPAGPTRGGTLRVGMNVMRVDHPARVDWIRARNIMVGVTEYLTHTGDDNITRPHLLEGWEASDDVKTWTLKLRRGIQFNHGRELTAEDVLFNFEQWFSDEVGSSMKGLLDSYVSLGDIEKVDDYTVRLHCTSPQIAVPEHLFHFPAMIVPKGFGGDWLEQPYGTGPYELVEWIPDERASIKKREGYWADGRDGNPLPYLDRVEFFDLGTERSPYIAALQAGQIDVINQPAVDDFLALRDDDSVKIGSTTTGMCNVIRMRVDLEPWTDVRVRNALKLCQDREKLIDVAYFGDGSLGDDSHVAPIHPEYCDIGIPEYDPEKAKALLADAGYPDGLDVEVAVSSAQPTIVSAAETLKADAEAAGFRITVNTMPGPEYWDVWTEVSLGITSWLHRSLGTMVLSLAYTSDADGNPVTWNETNWVDEEFDELLHKANATLDIEERRQIFCKLQRIQQERGSIGIHVFQPVWSIVREPVENLGTQPSQYLDFREVWLRAT